MTNSKPVTQFTQFELDNLNSKLVELNHIVNNILVYSLNGLKLPEEARVNLILSQYPFCELFTRT